jgi:hypothetical protein
VALVRKSANRRLCVPRKKRCTYQREGEFAENKEGQGAKGWESIHLETSLGRPGTEFEGETRSGEYDGPISIEEKGDFRDS